MQQDAGGHADIERFHLGGHGDAHPAGDGARHLGRQAGPLVAHDQCHAVGNALAEHLLQGLAVRVGREDLETLSGEGRGALRPGHRQCGVLEQRAHAAPHDLGVPEVHRAGQGDRGGDLQRRGGPDHRAHVSRVLQGVQDEQTGLEWHGVRQAAGGDLRHRQHALRRLRIGRTQQLGLRDLQHGNPPGPRLGQKTRATCVRRAIRTGQQPRDRQGRCQQGLHRAHALGHEALLALAALSALQITGKGQ